MALIVEDGTGKADADALSSAAAVAAYAEARGLTFTGDDAALDAAIRRATAYLSASFIWKGERLRGREQALAWPRVCVEDREGWPVPADSVPPEIAQACAELAVYELANPGGLSPAVDQTARVKREKVGPLETEYFDAPLSAEAARPVLTLVNDLVGGLLASGTSAYSGRAVRA